MNIIFQTVCNYNIKNKLNSQPIWLHTHSTTVPQMHFHDQNKYIKKITLAHQNILEEQLITLKHNGKGKICIF